MHPAVAVVHKIKFTDIKEGRRIIIHRDDFVADLIHREAMLRTRNTFGLHLCQRFAQSRLIDLLGQFGHIRAIDAPDTHVPEAVHVRHRRVRHKPNRCSDAHQYAHQYKCDSFFHVGSSLLLFIKQRKKLLAAGQLMHPR